MFKSKVKECIFNLFVVTTEKRVNITKPKSFLLQILFIPISVLLCKDKKKRD